MSYLIDITYIYMCYMYIISLNIFVQKITTDMNAEVNIPHITDIKNGAKTDEKSKSMKMHCNHFLLG